LRSLANDDVARWGSTELPESLGVIAPAATIIRSSRAVSRSLAGEGGAVLLNLDSGAYYSLNSVGLLVWSALEHESTFAALLERVRLEIDDASASLDDEIALFLRELANRELITIQG
jgi:Coenzyme PQQ synthesis protein D (PqqD)